MRNEVHENPVLSILFKYALRGSLFGIVSLFLLHSVIWHTEGQSSSIAVYGMKVVCVFSLIPLFLQGKLYFPKNKHFIFVHILGLLTVIFSTIMAVTQENFSVFYFTSDFIGFILFFAYLQCGYMLGIKNVLSDFQIFKELSIFLLFLTLIIIFGFLYSGGEKVSIPPDMHYASIYVILFILAKKNFLSKIKSFFLIFLISIASFVSLHKITFVSVIFCFLMTFVYKVRKLAVSDILKIMFLLSILCFLLMDYGSDFLYNFSVAINDDSTGFSDVSSNQRVLETTLIYEDLSSHTDLGLFFGKGFGAHYYNPDVIKHYPDFVHQGHFTPAVLWIRNGIFGVLIYLYLFLVSFRYIFSKNLMIMVPASCLFFSCLASLSDLYIYWGFFMGFGSGLLLSRIRKNNIGEKQFV